MKSYLAPRVVLLGKLSGLTANFIYKLPGG